MAEGKSFHLQIRLSMGGKLQQNDRDLFSDPKLCKTQLYNRGIYWRGRRCVMQKKSKCRRAAQSIHLFWKSLEEINNTKTIV